MSGTLYGMDVLRLAASSGAWPLLGPPAARATLRSPVCGSVTTVDLTLDEGGHIARIGIEAKACALGQAAATVFARQAVGRRGDALAVTARDIRAWLAGDGPSVPDWPGLDLLAGARAYPARHAAIALPFEAAARAVSALYAEPAA